MTVETNPLSSAEIQSLRLKIQAGEATLEDAMIALANIRKSWDAVPETMKATKPKADPKKPAEAFSEDF